MILRGFIRKEIKQTLRNPHLAFVILVMPIFQLLLFGFALTNEVTNVKIGFYFQPDDVVAREVYEHTMASGWFNEVNVKNVDPMFAIQSSLADVVFVAPSGGLTKNINSTDNKCEAQLLINGSNVLRAQSTDIYMQTIINNVYIKNMHMDDVVKKPILNFCVRTLYNPSLETSHFTVPAVIAILLTILVMMLSCSSIAKEKECGTFETILSAPIKREYIVLGKTIPFALMGLLNIVIVLFSAYLFFDLPIRGSIIYFFVASIIYIYAALMCGILLSTFVKNQQQAMLCFFIVFFIAMMLSGGFFPIDNMPKPLRWIANVNPLAHYIFLVRNILLKGGDTVYFLTHSFYLFIIGSVIGFVAYKKFKITLN